jgi:hypothetical protein
MSLEFLAVFRIDISAENCLHGNVFAFRQVWCILEFMPMVVASALF